MDIILCHFWLRHSPAGFERISMKYKLRKANNLFIEL